MTDREAALKQIAAGDIFHASGTNGSSFPCFALQVRDHAIFARRVTTQSVYWFDRTTGYGQDNPKIVIDSVAPLPDDIRELMLSIDRLFREAEYRHAEEPAWKPPEGYFRQSKDQIRALLFIADFYGKNQLPLLR